MNSRYTVSMVMASVLAAMPHLAVAGTCTVPGTHASIQAAVDDPACSDIELANQSYFEFLEIERSLALSGPTGGSATVMGQVQVTGDANMVMLSNFRVENGCPGGVLRVTGGSRANASGLLVVYDEDSGCVMDLFYRDGFEN